MTYAHPLGALIIVFAVMFFVASKDPVIYKFVVNMGMLRFALAVISHIITLVMVGKLFTFFWAYLVIDVVLFLLFLVVRPKAPAAARAA